MQMNSQSFVILSRCRPLLLSQKRYNLRESIHRYVEPEKFKKHMLAAALPYYKRVYQQPEDTCKYQERRKLIELQPLDRILLRELQEDVANSDYILLLQENWTPFQLYRVYKNTITKTGAKFQTFNNRVYKELFIGLGREDLTSWFIGKNALITGKVESLPACVKAFKRMPQFILLAGIIDNHMYKVDVLDSIASASNIDQARMNLLSTLTTPAIDLSSSIDQYGSMIKPEESQVKLDDVQQSKEGDDPVVVE